ncbi:MAG TPA: hypothetical protein VFM84_05515, partial [Holophagaceae bacterium]|nr:hypothetical protein [Holophagaceae bacterium]
FHMHDGLVADEKIRVRRGRESLRAHLRLHRALDAAQQQLRPRILRGGEAEAAVGVEVRLPVLVRADAVAPAGREEQERDRDRRAHQSAARAAS